MQLCGKVTDLLSSLGEEPEAFTGRILFMSMFNDISCDGEGNEEECVANSKVVSILAKKFGIGQWSFIGPGSEKKWYSMEEISVYRNNWWLRSNTDGSDTMPVRHRADFKQALSTLRQLKYQEDTAHQQRWKSYSSSWWNWQESWWHSSYEHHHEDGPSTD